MLSPITQRDIDISREERYAYYRSTSDCPQNTEHKITSIREPYKEERSLRDDNPVESRRTRSYSELKEDVELAQENVEKVLEDLRYYKKEYEDFLETVKDYQEPKEYRMIHIDDEIQEYIAQCQALRREIDLQEEKYSRIIRNTPSTSKYKVIYIISLRRI